ncbi:MAG: ABC-F family ATP-binding cassette domain-containing protein [Bacillota bacterium]|nr:ABC-F family ATP-binding cassette domain-containing protein [Bacillota bacterium]
MQLLRIRDLRVGFSDRDLFTISELDLYAGERVGLIGANGAGKSTLFAVLMGGLEPLSGYMERRGNWTHFEPFETAPDVAAMEPSDAALWGLGALYGRASESYSGGEKTRARLADLLARPGDLLLLDEPTANLDAQGVRQLAAALRAVPSAILISHDRALLDEWTTRTWEIREGQLFDYPGSYSACAAWREQEFARRRAAHEQYEAEKARLEALAQDQRQRALRTRRRPRGMSSSEAKMRAFTSSSRSYEGRGKRLDAAARHTEKRLERLEAVERPPAPQRIRPDFTLTDPPRNPVVAESFGLNFAWPGGEQLFRDARFQLRRGVHAALEGPNGCGKSTLLQLIAGGHPDIRSVPKARYGYFRQELDGIVPAETVLENVERVSVQRGNVNRGVLARMGFTQRRVELGAGLLSGGERVRLAFAMLFVSNANVLLIDEPTNFLDIDSLEAVEDLLCDFEGTLLLVSHERRLLDRVARERWTIVDRQIEVVPLGAISR